MDYVLHKTIQIIVVVDVSKIKDCLCRRPVYEQYEFPINDNTTTTTSSKFLLEVPESNDLCELKLKIICDFLEIIKKLKCGILPDLEFLLLEISLIYIYNE